MRLRRVAICALGAALAIASPENSARALQTRRSAEPTEHRIPVGNTSLYARVIGEGHAVIVLHGGPDFDIGDLLPDLDRLKDAYRLVYYDQRGRSRSAEYVRPEDVTMASDVDDIDRVRHRRATWR